MKCPYCGYVSFEHLENCRKCSKDLTSHKSQFGIDFLEPITIGAMALGIDSASSPAMVDSSAESFGTDDFSFGGVSDDSSAEEEVAEEESGIAIDLDENTDEPSGDDETIEIGTEEAAEAEMAVDEGAELGLSIDDDSSSADEGEGIAIDVSENTDGEESSEDIGFDLAKDLEGLEPPATPTEDEIAIDTADDDISIDIGLDDDEDIDLGEGAGTATDEIAIDTADDDNIVTDVATDDEIIVDTADVDDISIDLGLDDDDIDLGITIDDSTEDDIVIETGDEENSSLDIIEKPDVEDALAESSEIDIDPLAITDIGIGEGVGGIDEIPGFEDVEDSEAKLDIAEPDSQDEIEVDDVTSDDQDLDESTMFGVDITDEDTDNAPGQIEKMDVADSENGIQKDVEVSLDEFDNMNVADDGDTSAKIDLGDAELDDLDSGDDITLSLDEDSSSGSATEGLLDFEDDDDDIADSDLTLGEDTSDNKSDLDEGDDFLGELDFGLEDDEQK